MSNLKSLGQGGICSGMFLVVDTKMPLALTFFKGLGWYEIKLSESAGLVHYLTSPASFPIDTFGESIHRHLYRSDWRKRVQRNSLRIGFRDILPSDAAQVIQDWAVENKVDKSFRLENMPDGNVKVFMPDLFGFHLIIVKLKEI